MGDAFVNNDLYEYEIESITDSNTGSINKGRLKYLLTKYSKEGWRLKFALTNELGVNRSSFGYGGISSGTNATIDETLLIFERKVRTSSEIREMNRIAEEKEKERIEKEKKLLEMERQEKNNLLNNMNADMSSDELTYIYSNVLDKKKMIFDLMKLINEPITLAELRAKFGGNIDLMELGSYITALTNEGKIIKDEETKKYSCL